jgi:hypothetical protein
MTSPRRAPQPRHAVFTVGSPVDDWASIAVRFPPCGSSSGAGNADFKLKKETVVERPYSDRACAEGRDSRRSPFLGLHPGFAVPPAFLPIGTRVPTLPAALGPHRLC